jgi:hypothetical protein
MLGRMLDREWWRGGRPTAEPVGSPTQEALRTGPISALTAGPPNSAHARPLYFFRAEVDDAEVSLDDVHLAVEWSEFDHCHFRQRARQVTNAHNFAAQGSFANRPSIYRDCTFERIRFKTLGGFTLGQATFENCSFLNCRWEGHFAFDADLIGCTFEGKMNGCVWNGHGRPTADGRTRKNIIRDNDFTRTVFTANVAWRSAFPVDEQCFPEGHQAVVDD